MGAVRAQWLNYKTPDIPRTPDGITHNPSGAERADLALDPLQTIFHADMLDHLVSWTLVSRRFSLFLLGGFAIATLLLATAGVYGVMSFSTTSACESSVSEWRSARNAATSWGW